MQRLFNVGQTAFNLGNYLYKVVYVETSASWTSNHRHAPRSQSERLHNLPGDADFFLRLGGQGNTNRVADALMQKNSKTNRRLDGSTKCRPGFGHPKMKRVINFFGQQT